LLQLVTDRLSVDLALAIFCGVSYTAVVMVAREAWGPFNKTVIQAKLFLYKCENFPIYLKRV
jgi:hypothetical protein